MPPKNKFTKDQLIDVAFDIANKEGFNSITIRKIADKLGCSIAPIYVNFKDVDELKNEVVLKVINISKQLVLEQNSGNPFLDIGIASVIFAKKYPLLFDEFGLKNNEFYAKQNEAIDFAINQMKKDKELSNFSEQELELILFKMKAFQAGLSVLARNEQLSAILTDEMIIQMLDETGQDIIDGMRRRGGHDDELR
ncbi:MAG: TetR/AcrR family transcriptional regulator [Anaerovorax sp.]|nr:TetR/AcrR family transcriptional regulator [Anaerovorax sp.]